MTSTMKRIRRAVSFAGTSKKSQVKEPEIKSASADCGDGKSVYFIVWIANYVGW